MPRTVPKKHRFFEVLERLRQPDITGSFAQIGSNMAEKTGVFSLSEVVNKDNASIAGHGQDDTRLRFSAQASNGVFGRSQTVQSSALRLLPIIKA